MKLGTNTRSAWRLATAAPPTRPPMMAAPTSESERIELRIGMAPIVMDAGEDGGAGEDEVDGPHLTCCLATEPTLPAGRALDGCIALFDRAIQGVAPGEFCEQGSGSETVGFHKSTSSIVSTAADHLKVRS